MCGWRGDGVAKLTMLIQASKTTKNQLIIGQGSVTSKGEIWRCHDDESRKRGRGARCSSL